jgi:hypothetical protein
MKTKLLTLIASISILIGCSSTSWTMFKGEFFELTIPPGYKQTQTTSNLVVLESDKGKITLTWSKDQYSIKGYPAKEATTGIQGDKILVTGQEKIGQNVVWYTEVQTMNGWSVYLTLPLDRGELRIEANSKDSIIDIRQSVRSVVITNETYFSYPR